MNAREMAAEMQTIMEEQSEIEVLSARPFRETGLMTNNEGFVIHLADGSEFQVTVVQSRR